MNKSNVLKTTESKVKSMFDSDPTGHDFHHINRVRKNAVRIAKTEGADPFITELAALVHDIGDYKVSSDDQPQREQVITFLTSSSVDDDLARRIADIVDDVSFKGAGVDTSPRSLEGKCVQDADRLDALGAIGIARCFAYGGKKGQPIHDPTIDRKKHGSFEEYKSSRTTSINHFYEKLLLLKDRMQTSTGKKMAEDRHERMIRFLDDFFEETDE